MEKTEPHFSKGGKWEKFHPVYDGFATFLFTPGHTTSKGTHIRDGIDLKRTMFYGCIGFNFHVHYLECGTLDISTIYR